MKGFLKSLKSDNGFTLVELMVVIAIIGLVSSVAIPNFKKYQAKAKISEARLQLSAAYTAQQSFFADYNLFANCLKYMGFDPSAEKASRYYSVGFDDSDTDNNASTTEAWKSAVNSGLGDGCVAGAAGGVENDSLFSAGKGVGSKIISDLTAHNDATDLSALGDQSDSDNMTFIISAAGIISGDAATEAEASVLTLDHKKILKVIRQGY